MDRFDALVIGTGQAGPSLARRCAAEGLRVAVVERHLVGGTCVNTGCIPSKTLIASARAAHVAKTAARLGVLVPGEVRVDMAKVRERVRSVSLASRDAVTRGLESTENLRLVRGHARLVDPRTVAVGDEVLTADRIFLNVGARARVPEIPGLDEVPFLTNTSLLQLDVLPRHLVVVGGSTIGVEFGQAFRRLGSAVTILQRGPRLVPREDEDVSEALREVLLGEGIDVRTNAECLVVEARGDDVVVTAACGGAPVLGSHLLVAVGRVPNTHDLGLDAAGVEVDAHGYVRVDGRLQTTAKGVFALGDCNGRGAFTHTSYDDFAIVEANLFDGGHRSVDDRVPAYAIFTDPPLGRAGMTEREARASGRNVRIARYDMENVGRAFERDETAGFMKVLVDADDDSILGAAILGIEGDEVVHVLLDAMIGGVPASTIAKAMHVHPTVAEFLPVLLSSLEPLED